MDFDFSSVERAGFDSSTLASTNTAANSAVPAEAGTAFADLDGISASPLAYFGSMVEQVGKSMIAEGQQASTNGADPSHGVSDAIDMLDSLVSMMSLFAGGAEPTDGGASALTDGATLRALDSET